MITLVNLIVLKSQFQWEYEVKRYIYIIYIKGHLLQLLKFFIVKPYSR